MTRWLHSTTLGAVLLLATAAQATDPNTPPARHRKHVAPRPGERMGERPLAAEVAALRAEVAALSQRLDAANAAAQQAQAAAAQAQASARAAQSSTESVAQNEQLAIDQIPADVDTAVARLPKPRTDGWYFKGVKFTPGGFIAAESVYRTRFLGSDETVPFANIPYFGSSLHGAHTQEWRQTARQSRVTGLTEGDVNPDIHLSAYGEFDFLGAAQTANSNESNSYNLRIRALYTTADFKNEGLSLLAGQNWTLATLNDEGITPHNEVIPKTIDAQYTVGFVWARQPQLRLTEDFGNGVWVAVSAETPQTNSTGGNAALLPGVGSVTFNQPAQSGSLFNAAVNYSFNHVPDVIGKVAWDDKVAGRHLHVEGFGIFRDFSDRVGTGCNSSGTNCTAFHNDDTAGGGGGFGVVGQIIPDFLDGQASGLFGRGLGRYGASQFSDVFVGADGALQGIREELLLGGLTLHANKSIDIWGYFGAERAYASSYAVGGVQGGYGDPLFSNLGGCEVASDPACNGDTQLVEEATLGLWDRAYSGEFGSFRLGLQYAYVRRDSFSGIVNSKPLTFGQVQGDDNMIYTSIRYYPFQP
jgi:hypothetical protein